MSSARPRSRAGLFEGHMIPSKPCLWGCRAALGVLVPAPLQGRELGGQGRSRAPGRSPPCHIFMHGCCSHPLSGEAGELVGMGVWEKWMQRQLHGREDFSLFWVTIAAEGAQLQAQGEIRC